MESQNDHDGSLFSDEWTRSDLYAKEIGVHPRTLTRYGLPHIKVGQWKFYNRAKSADFFRRRMIDPNKRGR